MTTETSGPNSVLRSRRQPREVPLLREAGCTDATMPTRLNSQCSTFRCLLRPSTIVSEPKRMEQANLLMRLLRKEVIQPHLPVRLPCYDLVLLASPTFDGSLHTGWATGFGCYRLS